MYTYSDKSNCKTMQKVDEQWTTDWEINNKCLYIATNSRDQRFKPEYFAVIVAYFTFFTSLDSWHTEHWHKLYRNYKKFQYSALRN